MNKFERATWFLFWIVIGFVLGSLLWSCAPPPSMERNVSPKSSFVISTPIPEQSTEKDILIADTAPVLVAEGERFAVYRFMDSFRTSNLSPKAMRLCYVVVAKPFTLADKPVSIHCTQ